MHLYYIKYLMFTKNKNIKKICEIDRKTNLYSRCMDCSLKNVLDY